jgi:Ca2+-binding RTX toxin-like protein
VNRTSHLTLVLALGSGLGLASVGLGAGPSYAADTCHGLPVTIQGSPQHDISGTSGDDVIVTNGAANVWAGPGNDTVCVVGGAVVGVLAQEGDDYVEVDDHTDVEVFLGLGSDTYRGGSGSDFVRGAGEPGLVDSSVDSERDDIETGDGDDDVLSGQAGQPNPDRLVLGDGYDVARIVGTTGIVDGGPGPNQLRPATDPAQAPTSWAIDERAGVITKAGAPAWQIAGFTDLALRDFAIGSEVSVVATDAHETLDLYGRPSGGSVSVVAGGGNDKIALGPGVSVSFSGGGGRDRIELIRDHGGSLARRGLASFRMDRGSGRVVTNGVARSWSYDSVEALTVLGFARITAVGTRKGEAILAGGACDVTIRGGGGDDLLRRQRTESCGHGQSTTLVAGGPGDDVLIGSLENDVLLGGPGHDAADGRAGRDRCQAEQRRGCELR